jgi:cytidine deaminase
MAIAWDALFEAATRARERAYAPYSKFRVGAAVLGDDGRIYPGANVENSSYGLSLCAERNAVSRAVLEGSQKILAVAIVAQTQAPCPPCGMCRQTLAEFADPSIPVKSRTLEGVESEHRLDALLPSAFTGKYL